MGSFIGMPTRLPLRFFGMFALLCLLVPAALAVSPLWIVNATPGESLSAVAMAHDGSVIVAGGDQLIAISPTGEKLWAGWSGSPLAVSADGGYIAAAQGQLVQLISGQGILLWQQPLGETVTALSLSPDAEVIAAGGGTSIQSWYNSGAGMGKNTTGTVQDLAVSPEKDQILVCTAGALQSFNLSYVPFWNDTTFNPSAVAISGDGTGIVAVNGNRVRMYHGGGVLLWNQAFPGGNIISLAYSNDGSTIVAGRDDGTVLDIGRNGNLIWTGTAGAWATSVAVSDNGSTVATGSIDNRIHVYDGQGTLLGEAITKNPVKSRSVAVSGDGSLIVAVDNTNVYGFSRSQFATPANLSAASTPAMGGTTNTTLPSSPVSTTLMSTLSATAPGTAQGASPAPAGTTMPGFSPPLVLCAFAALAFAKGRLHR
jgi:WD40 repeat protein